MINSDLAYSYQNYVWNLPKWNYLVEEIAKVFKLTEKEKVLFENNNTAKIIATIPFEAKCTEPERTAIAHLCLYMSELRGFQKYCSHLPSDDINIYNRLAFISTFEDGNQKIINHGMSILALIMIEGYKRTYDEDSINKIYNPFVSGKWNYQSIREKLLWEINKIQVPQLDWILTSVPLNIW